MIRHTDELFDLNGDGELGFHERCERDIFEEELIRKMNGESEDDEDEGEGDDLYGDDDDFDEDDDFDDDDSDDDF